MPTSVYPGVMDPRPDLATAYDNHVLDRESKGEPHWRAPHREAFAAQLPPGGRVLELGAGVGFTARWFADQGFEVLATDLAPANVEMCRRKGVQAQVADLLALELDGLFDGIWAASCLMHVPNEHLQGVLVSVADLLADSGLFWAGTWGGPDSEGVLEEDWYRPKRFYSIRSDGRMRSLYATSFDLVSFETIDPAIEVGWHYQMARLQKKSG